MNCCPECYSQNNRATPLLNEETCLRKHTQYICGTCGRCICVEEEQVRGVQRWNFPFASVELARLYLRAADFTVKSSCGIYEVISESGRKSYEIFATTERFKNHLQKNEKHAAIFDPLFQKNEFILFPNTQVRKLTSQEVSCYLAEKRTVS